MHPAFPKCTLLFRNAPDSRENAPWKIKNATELFSWVHFSIKIWVLSHKRTPILIQSWSPFFLPKSPWNQALSEKRLFRTDLFPSRESRFCIKECALPGLPPGWNRSAMGIIVQTIEQSFSYAELVWAFLLWLKYNIIVILEEFFARQESFWQYDWLLVTLPDPHCTFISPRQLWGHPNREIW